MFCPVCSKLARLATKKKCAKCGVQVLDNLSVICSKCSDKFKICAACLRKLTGSFTKRLKNRGCGNCKGR